MLAPLELLCHPCVTKPEDLWGTHVRVKIIACQTVGEEIGRLLETAEFDGSLPLPSGQVEPSVQELPFGLHNIPTDLFSRVQEEVDASQDADVIVLGYGLCGLGLNGVKS